ncbi:SWIM zinc finger family protein [Nocardioides sp.]|uniref:SWIM zinc finger family protein n=1 Tax=Nocardioides sp. TaxID=35761 RepID=UPI002735A9DA|nr:SWIM zinc finger family protein [Nocardioides sp.]MDP3889911.1 SWIM zinc finger family protein [Nocardioides sp.]
MGSAITHPRFAPRRGGSRAVTWWGKAWVRAVEEAAYGEIDLRRGRAAARGGQVGSLTVDSGSVVAAVDEGDDTWTVRVGVPVLADGDRSMLVEVVAAESGRIAALMSGDLPHTLVEQLEDAGVELLPYGGELDADCSCDAWMQPCPHALAVMLQLGWLVDADPFVLLALRGADRESLLSALHERGTAGAAQPVDPVELDLEVALTAVQHAADLLAALEQDDASP